MKLLFPIHVAFFIKFVVSWTTPFI